MALLPLEAEIESLVLHDLLAAIDDRPNDGFVRFPLARHPGGNPLVVVNDRDRAVGRCLPQREVQAAQLSEDIPALLQGYFNLFFGTQRGHDAAVADPPYRTSDLCHDGWAVTRALTHPHDDHPNSTPIVPVGEHVQTRLEDDPSSFQQRLSFSFVVDLLVLRSFDTFDRGATFVPCLADALDRVGF